MTQQIKASPFSTAFRATLGVFACLAFLCVGGCVAIVVLLRTPACIVASKAVEKAEAAGSSPSEQGVAKSETSSHQDIYYTLPQEDSLDASGGYLKASQRYLRTIISNNDDLSQKAAMVYDGDFTLEELRVFIAQARRANDSAFMGMPVAAPPDLEELHEAILVARDRECAGFDEMLRYWDDGLTDHLNSGIAVFNKATAIRGYAMQLYGECVDDHNARVSDYNLESQVPEGSARVVLVAFVSGSPVVEVRSSSEVKKIAVQPGDKVFKSWSVEAVHTDPVEVFLLDGRKEERRLLTHAQGPVSLE